MIGLVVSAARRAERRKPKLTPVFTLSQGEIMPRLMSYNIEWFTKAFNPDNSLSTEPDAVKQLDAVDDVITATDADLIGITEGPNTTTTTGQRDTVTALKNFAQAKGLRQSDAMIGFPSAGQQEIAVLFDPAKFELSHDPGGDSGSVKNPRFDEAFQADSDGDGVKELYKHYRPPLEAKIVRKDNNSEFWLMVAHAKSKGIFSAMDRVHFDRVSDRNRRKLFAECESIRKRVDEWLAQDRAVAVMGDINDGPGFDYYEGNFGRSAVELVMGNLFNPDDILRNYVGEPQWGRYGWEPSTVRFTDRFTGDRINALIDHILVSRHFTPGGNDPAIVWNPFQTDAAKPLRSELFAASDHFPITLDIA